VFCVLIGKGKEERDFTAEAQRGKRGRSRKGIYHKGQKTHSSKSQITNHKSRSSGVRLNTKAPRHKGQRERDEK